MPALRVAVPVRLASEALVSEHEVGAIALGMEFQGHLGLARGRHVRFQAQVKLRVRGESTRQY